MSHVRVEQGDCLEVMARLAADGIQVDSIVTDPPYHLTSIVKRFGGKNAAPAKVGKTGAYARASSGFMGQKWDGGDIAFRPETWRLAYDLLKPGGHLLAFSHTRTYHRMVCAIEDAGFEIRDQLGWLYSTGFPKSHNLHGELEGRGTALKPAQEPVVMARKPLLGTVAENVLAYGTGALNIDGCRIHGDDAQGGEYTIKRFATGASVNQDGRWKQDAAFTGQMRPGRWPANVIHDGSDEVLAAFPAAPGQQARAKNDGSPQCNNIYGALRHGTKQPEPRGDSGTAARFFYSAKADKSDRLGSKHPTVKPVDLMAYLCRLVTPPGGMVLDPFAGSGTTGMACLREGFDALLIERDESYVADIRRRLDHVEGADAPLFAGIAPENVRGA